MTVIEPPHSLYLYFPLIVTDSGLMPSARRAKGRSRPDGYYWHDDPASVGLPWVAAAIASMPDDRRFPFPVTEAEPAQTAALIYKLAENLGYCFHAYAKQIEHEVRFYETRELVTKLLNSDDSSAAGMARDFTRAESMYIAHALGASSSKQWKHRFWLKPDDEPVFRPWGEKSKLVITDPRDAVQEMRAAITTRFPRICEAAAREAHRYCRSHRALAPLRFYEHADNLCRIRPDQIARTPPHRSIYNGSLARLRPQWAASYIEHLQRIYDRDPLGWEKVVFRLVEPGTRAEEFNAARKSRRRPCARKAYFSWEYSKGRYAGVTGTDHGAMMNSMRVQDSNAINHLRELAAFPSLASLDPVKALCRLRRVANAGHEKLLASFP